MLVDIVILVGYSLMGVDNGNDEDEGKCFSVWPEMIEVFCITYLKKLQHLLNLLLDD